MLFVRSRRFHSAVIKTFFVDVIAVRSGPVSCPTSYNLSESVSINKDFY